MAGQVAYVFVSYKAEDRTRLKPLVDALEAEGFAVWWDARIGGGTNWRRDIEEHLDAARCVLVAWTKRSVGAEGEFVRDEAGQARKRGTYLPVRFDAVELPLGFREVQAISLKGWRGDRSDPRFQEVADAVRSHLSGEHTSPAHPNLQDRNVSRRALLTGGALVSVAVAGIGIWELLRPSSASASGSVAVLPFENLSGDPAQAYFSDGIAEEIRSALARIAGLKVVGRTSSEAVRNDDAKTAAKKLGVTNILTGSVRQSPSTIRINAELVDGLSGLDRWSQDYDRSPGDAIKIQTDIAENVANALSAALGGAVRKALTIGGTQNAKAQRLFLEGKQVARGETKVAVQHAIGLFDQAISLDGGYADAHAFRAIYLEDYADHFAIGATELAAIRSQAAGAANSAIRLAVNLAAAHRALAFIYSGQLDVGRSIAESKKAFELAPGPDELSDYAFSLAQLGRTAQADELSQKAVALDPLNIDAYRTRFIVLMCARRYADAISFSEELRRNSPQLFDWPAPLGSAFLFLGRNAEAQQFYDLAPPDSYLRLVGESSLLARTGKAAEVKPRLAKLQQLFGDAASYQFAEVYAQLGDKDRAFGALGRAWAIRDSGLWHIKIDQFLDPIRDDPRFASAVARMNFPS